MPKELRLETRAHRNATSEGIERSSRNDVGRSGTAHLHVGPCGKPGCDWTRRAGQNIDAMGRQLCSQPLCKALHIGLRRRLVGRIGHALKSNNRTHQDDAATALIAH